MKFKDVCKRLSKSLFSHWLVLGVFFAIGVGIFSISQGTFAAANIWGWLGTAATNTAEMTVGVVAGGLSLLFGRLLLVVIQVLLRVAQYNDFISSPAATLGWIVMRDMANMFFVFLLLAIAIGTILQQEKYSYRTMLPAFIMAAILVNFSKTIAGFVIDVSQVIMNTFVAAFSSAGGGNFATLLGVPKFMAIVGLGDTDKFQGNAYSFILALVFILVALIVVSTLTMFFIMRIIGLWFLVVLSPWAFMLNVVPRGQEYAKKWWESFINLVLLGPVAAFFLWLSLAVVSQVNNGVTDINKTTTAGLLSSQDVNEEGIPDGLNAGGTEIGTYQGVIGYFLGIGMLVATLMAASELGAGGGKMAGAASGAIMNWAKGKSPVPSPMRWARDRGAAVWNNLEQARKKGVNRDAQRVTAGIGWVAEKGANLAAKPGELLAKGAEAVGAGVLTKNGRTNIKAGYTTEIEAAERELKKAQQEGNEKEKNKQYWKIKWLQTKRAAVSGAGYGMEAGKFVASAASMNPLVAAGIYGNEISGFAQTGARDLSNAAKYYQYDEAAEEEKNDGNRSAEDLAKRRYDPSLTAAQRHGAILAYAKKGKYGSSAEIAKDLAVLKGTGDEKLKSAFVSTIGREHTQFGMTLEQRIEAYKDGSLDPNNQNADAIRGMIGGVSDDEFGEAAFAIVDESRFDTALLKNTPRAKACYESMINGIGNFRTKGRMITDKNGDQKLQKLDIKSGTGINKKKGTYNKYFSTYAKTLIETVNTTKQDQLDQGWKAAFGCEEDGSFGSDPNEAAVNLATFKEILAGKDGKKLIEKTDKKRFEANNYDNEYAKAILEAIANKPDMLNEVHKMDSKHSKPSMRIILRAVMRTTGKDNRRATIKEGQDNAKPGTNSNVKFAKAIQKVVSERSGRDFDSYYLGDSTEDGGATEPVDDDDET
ncbi:MAG: hypothetical protein Q8P11_00300 [bacterium]|nr:hypothetical protein [bacterium]